MEKSDDLLFVHGASIPGPDLQHWLSQQHDLIRLPIVLRWSAGTAIEVAELGVPGSRENLPVSLVDHTADHQLAARAREACPGSMLCCVWLDGFWRPAQPGNALFEVTGLDRALSDSESGAPVFARVAVERGTRRELVDLAIQLGTATPLEEKRKASRALVAAGRDAMPVLIASLGDDRTYESRDTTNRMNLPYGENPKQSMGTLTVGMRCEDLLYEIITPIVTAPAASNFKVFSEQKLRVADWPTFWASHRKESLAQIQAPLKPLVEAYWREHGTTQNIQ